MSDNLYRLIDKLTQYGLHCTLIEECDRIYCTNVLLAQFNETSYDGKLVIDPEFDKQLKEDKGQTLQDTLDQLVDIAIEKNLCEDTTTQRRIFDTKLMDALMPKPSQVCKTFKEKYSISPKEATVWYYNLSLDSNYIRRSGLKRDVHWEYQSPYGRMEILISLTKPEKDPKDILKAKLAPQSSYPKCALCKENVGYIGRANAEARSNHRIISVVLNNNDYYLQYSPYGYCNHHLIFFSKEHRPMAINDDALKAILDAVTLFPHYFVGSNTDLPYVGGSILAHDHFQGGWHNLPVFEAKEKYQFNLDKNVKTSILYWPISTIKLQSDNKEDLFKVASKILKAWRAYNDSSVGIYSKTNNEIHNTLTPIAIRKDNDYVMVLQLRNNRRSETRPDGIFHVHPSRFNIKKEGLGVIDVPGIAILPPRLKAEMQQLAQALKQQQEITENQNIAKHKEWVNTFIQDYPNIQDKSLEDIKAILKEQISLTFTTMLEDCAVFKQDPQGQEAFCRFMEHVQNQ